MSTELADPIQTEFPLVTVDQALESYRESGFDLATAAGEAVDNAIEAGATIVQIKTFRTDKDVTEVAFSDNGEGIRPSILGGILSLGYSSRYNERHGLGRFGVGLKLAGLSQGRRIDVWTIPAGEEQVYHTYVDLDEVRDGRQTVLSAQPVSELPPDYADLLSDPTTGEQFASGTVVLFSNVDRLTETGRYKSSIAEALAELEKFIARAYRKFLDGGLRIFIDQKNITLHDPTFTLANPRIDDYFGEPVRGEVIYDGDIDVEGKGDPRKQVRVLVTLAPERFRVKRGRGGKDDASITLIKPDIVGRVSLLRQRREIYYDVIPRLFPDGRTDIDRFIGVEISFPATLDEYFHVRNVKRGAEPDRKLRDEIRKKLVQPVELARKKIRAVHEATAAREREEHGGHKEATDAANRKDAEYPRGRAGSADNEEAKDKIERALTDGDKKPTDQEVADVQERFKTEPIQYRDGAWPGKDLFALTHVNGAFILTLNHSHALIAKVYDQLTSAVKSDEPVSPADASVLLQKAIDGFDVLLLAYGKAESVDPEADKKYGNLRTFWGTFAEGFIEERLADRK